MMDMAESVELLGTSEHVHECTIVPRPLIGCHARMTIDHWFVQQTTRHGQRSVTTTMM